MKKSFDSEQKRLEHEARMLFDAGEWFMFAKSFLMILKPDEALLLAAMINLARCVGTGERREASRGWFYYSIKHVQNDLRYDRKKQARIIRKLRNMRIVKYRLVGDPAHREFKIRFRRVKELVDDAIAVNELVKKPPRNGPCSISAT